MIYISPDLDTEYLIAFIEDYTGSKTTSVVTDYFDAVVVAVKFDPVISLSKINGLIEELKSSWENFDSATIKEDALDIKFRKNIMSKELDVFAERDQLRETVKNLSIELIALKDKSYTDVVEHPNHYKQHPSGVECIQITEHFNFNIGNAIKYLWRSNYKGGLVDLQKAKWYIEREIERISNAKNTDNSIR